LSNLFSSENPEVSEVEIFGAVVAELVAFLGFEGDEGTRGEGVSLAVDGDGEGSGSDKKGFGHVEVGVGGSHLAGFEDGVGELGEVGNFAIGEEHLFLDRGVVGDVAPRELRAVFDDHECAFGFERNRSAEIYSEESSVRS